MKGIHDQVDKNLLNLMFVHQDPWKILAKMRFGFYIGDIDTVLKKFQGIVNDLIYIADLEDRLLGFGKIEEVPNNLPEPLCFILDL
jgi:hypothetical protein